MTDEQPDADQAEEFEWIQVTDAAGEVTSQRRRRLGLDGYRNGKFSNNFVQGAIRQITILRVILLAIGAVVSGMTVVLTILFNYYFLPQIMAHIQTADAPIALKIQALEKQQDDHLLAVATSKSDYPTRQDLNLEINRVSTQLSTQMENGFDRLQAQITAEQGRRK